MGSHSLLQGIFLTQGSNLGLLHCKQILCRLSHRGNPSNFLLAIYFTRTGTSFSFADILHHLFFSLNFNFSSTCSIEYNPNMVFLCLKVFYWLSIIILCKKKKWVCKLKFEFHFSLYVTQYSMFDLLCSTGNYIQHFIITYRSEESEKEYIYSLLYSWN